MAKALVHLDGCHFFVWVHERDGGEQVLDYYERARADLAVHGEPAECARCRALRDGTEPHAESVHVELGEDMPGAWFALLEVIAGIQERVENG